MTRSKHSRRRVIQVMKPLKGRDLLLHQDYFKSAILSNKTVVEFLRAFHNLSASSISEQKNRNSKEENVRAKTVAALI